MTELTEKQTANEETTNKVETKTELSVDEKALKALNEACANYGLEPYNIAKVMSDKIKEQCNLMKNEANMYRQELDKTKAKVDYKELIARDVTAQRIIDNHNKELMQRQYDIAEGLIKYHLTLNLSEQQLEGVKMVADAFKIPFDKAKQMVEKQINEKAKEINKTEIDNICDKIKSFFGEEQYEKFMTSF